MPESLRITSLLLILLLALSCSHNDQEKWDFVEFYDSSENKHTGLIKSSMLGDTAIVEIDIFKNTPKVVDQLNYVDSLNANLIITDELKPVEYLSENLVKSISIQISKEHFKETPLYTNVFLNDDEMVMTIPGLGISIDYSNKK